MTVAVAWVGKRKDGREHLFVASDSRLRGGHVLDACPKILTLPRSDSVLCFAGSTAAAYPLMLQIAYAIGAHRPSRDRAMDLGRLKAHVLKVCTDLMDRFRVPAAFQNHEVQFLLAGYSWLTASFRIWTIDYNATAHRFEQREAKSFAPRLQKAAFIGDKGRALRNAIMRNLGRAPTGPDYYLEPLKELSAMLLGAGEADTIGGAPQVVRIAKHMNTRSFCVEWKGQRTLYGRPLFDYESVDYWVIDPINGKLSRPAFPGDEEEEDSTGGAGGPAADAQGSAE